MTEKKAGMFGGWCVKDTTNFPYLLQNADFCDKYDHPVFSVFKTRQDARDWINENRCGYKWHPVKVYIQEL